MRRRLVLQSGWGTAQLEPFATALAQLRAMRTECPELAALSAGPASCTDRASLILELLLSQPETFEARRLEMVDRIEASWRNSGGNLNWRFAQRVLETMRTIPRHEFVDSHLAELAYLPIPLDIGHSQTISQPIMVASIVLAAELVEADHVLDVGTGSGYQAAILAQLAAKVVSVEIIPAFAQFAAERLARLALPNVEIYAADGGYGWAATAPYDAILVAAGASSAPSALLAQLAIGGRLVMPLGRRQGREQLIRITRRDADRFDYCDLGPTTFVPVTGISARRGKPRSERHRSPFCFGAAITNDVDPLLRPR